MIQFHWIKLNFTGALLRNNLWCMAKRRILDANLILQVETTRETDPQLLEHINSTILGTPGGLRYQQTRINEKLNHISDIHFMILTRQDKVLGSVGFIKRSIDFKTGKAVSWYIRYFSIKAPLRSGSYKRSKLREPSKGLNILKDISFPYVKNPSRLLQDFDPDQKSLVYAYVENENLRSMNFSEQMEAVTVRKYTTIIFSRAFLKKISGIRRLLKEEVSKMKKLLRDFYKDHNFYIEENLFMDDNYFILEEDGEIIAGAQVHPEIWKIMDMKGKYSRLLLRFLPLLPFIRRIFNPDSFKFLAMEGIWYKSGYEHKLNVLFEGLCSEFRVHFVLCWVDHDSKLNTDLSKNINCGLIGNSFERAGVDVRVTFNNFTEKEKQIFYERPAYISAFDMV